MWSAIVWLSLEFPIDHPCHLVLLVGARPALADVFVQVLRLCQKAGLVNLG